MTRGAIRRRLGRSYRDERGVVLVLVAVLMVALLAITGLAIDIGGWYGVQRQAQAAADAAALAGAQDLPGSQATASTDASLYAQKDFPGVTVATPTFPQSDEIKVTVTTTAPVFFAKILGISAPTVSATATAQKTSSSPSCTTPGNTCYAVFAMDSSCSGIGVVFGGGTHITGGVGSNGALNVGGGGSSFGPTTYGTGCTVAPSGYQGQNNTFTSGPTAQAPIASWPIDYATDFPPCTGAACTGPGGTPSFCTQSTTASSETLQNYNPVNLISGNIYCDVGSGTAGTPSTWNGAITVNMGSGTVAASFVAGSVSFGGGVHLTSCGYAVAGYVASGCGAGVPAPTTTNYPLVYAVGTGTPISDPGGGGHFTGDFFAPYGTISFGSGGNSTTFLEAQDVVLSGGGDTGDGPTYTGTGSSGSSGTSALIQ